jgi:multiple sugar transport system ATP-binding protein
LISRIPDALEVANGSAVGFSIKPHHCHLFDSQGEAMPRTTPPTRH